MRVVDLFGYRVPQKGRFWRIRVLKEICRSQLVWQCSMIMRFDVSHRVDILNMPSGIA